MAAMWNFLHVHNKPLDLTSKPMSMKTACDAGSLTFTIFKGTENA